MRYLIVVLVLVLAACAVSLKQKAVAAHAVAQTAFGAAQDAEIALYKARTVPLLPERHIEIQQTFKRVFELQITVGAALQSWTPDQPVPQSVRDWIAAVEQSLTLFDQRMPKENTAFTAVWTQLRIFAKQVVEVAKMTQAVAGAETIAIAGGAR